MWELDCEEGWAPQNWCFWTVVLEKMLESPLDCKEIQPVNPKGNQSWIFTVRTDAEAPILCPLDSKSRLTGKDPDAGKNRRQQETPEDEMVGQHHRLREHEFEQTLGVGDGQGGLACCSPWGRRAGQDWVTEQQQIKYKIYQKGRCVLCFLIVRMHTNTLLHIFVIKSNFL